jgi:PKD repeat protein
MKVNFPYSIKAMTSILPGTMLFAFIMWIAAINPAYSQGYQGMHSATDSVIVATTNTVSDWGRGFRFEPTVDLYVYHIGKRVPGTGVFTWIIWDYLLQTKVFQQNSVKNNAGNWEYEKCDSVVKLKAGRQYILEMYATGSAMYYYGASSQVGQHLIYYDQRYCACAVGTFPTSVLTNIHYGTPDFLYSLTPILKGKDNAGVASIDSPSNFCAGTYDVKASIQNFGTNRIDSVRVNWSVDGVLQPVYKYLNPLDTMGGTGVNKAQVTLGSVSFITSAGRTIRVWTSFPNGVTDTVPSNDSITVTLKPSLNGSFTIGGTSPDYPTIGAAVNDLNNFGVCGPVNFTIRAGTYNEQVTLNQVAGASSVNTITFDGVDPNTRTITFAGTAANPHTFKLNGSDYVTIKNLTINNTGTASAFSLHLTNQADYNNIANCRIRASNTTTVTTIIPFGIMGAGYTGYGNNGNYNVIDGCTIDGGYINAALIGVSTTTFCNNNTMKNCTFTGGYLYGVYSYYQSGVKITDNSFTLRTTTNSYGAYFYYNVGGFVIDRNKVKSQYMGLYLSSCNTTGSLRGSVSNNMVWGQNYSTIYQIYNATVSNTDFFHNTTYSTGNGYNFYFSGGTNNNIRNNIFMRTSPTTYAMYLGTTSVAATVDHNNYYTTAAGNFVYMGAAYANLAALKTLATYNQNSISVLPNFVSLSPGAEDLHLTSGVPAPYGANAGVTVDVDGDTRCLFAPTLGADESKYIVLAPVAGFSVPDSVWLDAPTNILNAASSNEAKAHRWYLNGALISSAMNLSYTFNTLGDDTLKLVTQSCGGVDSIEKIFTVYFPTRVPQSEFVSDKNQIGAYEDVQFTDLSVNGASQWNWTVIPSGGVTITSANSQNPVMSFSIPGDYRVCLTASNALGSGNTECKNAYIRVGDVQYVCSAPFSSNASIGNLFDSGGPLTPYAANENCSFLIDPCASSVTIRFNMFNLGNVGDEMKIYDGGNATTGTLLGTFTSTSGNPGGSTGLTATSGKMFLVWKTDGATQGNGFEAEWSSVPASFAKPAVSFIMPDTAYIDQPVQFKSTTSGDYLNFSWDVDAPNNQPGDNGGYMANEVYTYNTAGTYFVRLTVTNCGGLDTLTKAIIVVNPTNPPNPVDFMADFTRLTLQDTAQLTDLSGHGASSWQWSASPSSGVKFIPNNTVYNPRITISTPGLYDIKLVVSNAIGSDSVTKTGYLRVVSYCVPSVANLNSDAGISRVRLPGSNNTLIDNSSAIGASGYTDYSQNGQNALLELGGTYTITVSRNTTNNKLNRKAWIDWNGDGDLTDPGEEVASESSAQTLSWTAGFTVPATATVGYARLRVGTNLNNLSNPACGPNSYGEFEDYRVIVSEDITSPVITLLGSDTVYIEQYRAYTDAGATALDQLNGNLTPDMYNDPNTVSTISTDNPGTYTLKFNVKDANGNAAVQRTRTVVISPDTTRPQIVLTGSSPMVIQVLNGFTDPGVTATDFRSSGNVPVTVSQTSNVDPNVIGSYEVVYIAVDSLGNVATISRIVEVTDTVKPNVTLVGSDPTYVEVKTAFIDSMVLASDNYYPQSGLTITSDGNTKVNSNIPGTYTVTYTVTDASGNVTVLTRIVIVRDTQKPLVVLKGAIIDSVNVFSLSYNDPGATVTDNYNSLTYTRTGTVNLSVLGDYILRYFTADNSGNLSDTVDRIVRVVDRKKPEIALIGNDFVFVERWTTYVDSGATVNDNYYTGLVPIVNNNVNTLKEGVYFVHFDAEDLSGNKADRVTRTVIVGKNSTGTPSPDAENGFMIYPNPGRGVFNISMQRESIMNAEVYNSLGSLVKSASSGIEITKAMELDLSGLAEGVYFVKVQAGDLTITRRIMLAR